MAIVRVGPHRCAAVFAVAALAGVAAIAGLSVPASASVVCPASAAAGGPVQWVFGQLGAPSPPSKSLSWTWTRGSGTWNGGRATGAICAEDKGGGRPTRHLVLSVSGSSTLSPGITRLGLPGVGIRIVVRVTASDDPACPRGTPGSVTLFASYYSVHRDSIVMHFAAACTGHNHTFTGSTAHVEIDRNGAQVNSA